MRLRNTIEQESNVLDEMQDLVSPRSSPQRTLGEVPATFNCNYILIHRITLDRRQRRYTFRFSSQAATCLPSLVKALPCTF